MSLKNCILTLILSFSILVPVTSNAQFWKKENNKKTLKIQIEKLSKEVDSLKSIIEGGAIELADTTQFDETQNTEEYTFTNSHIFENAEPGCNPDSLLDILYNERPLCI